MPMVPRVWSGVAEGAVESGVRWRETLEQEDRENADGEQGGGEFLRFYVVTTIPQIPLLRVDCVSCGLSTRGVKETNYV